MAKVMKRPLKPMERLSGAKVTKRPLKPMERLSEVKVTNCPQKGMKRLSEAKVTNVFAWTKAMKRVPLDDDESFLTLYVAKPCVTEQQMLDHYQEKIIPWLEDHQVTEVKCWIARCDCLLILFLKVLPDYLGEWNKIEGIQELYRSGPGGVLMEALLLSEDYIGNK